ncbi:hypothetical protein B0J17DRAFT_665151 [Rhizoctonia solani]|nr:hypothetical protein B0J17DRAFT_665151 [Rhizoctonia solani]
MGLCTTKFQRWESPITIGTSKRPFYLIDSPGFGTNTLSNPNILKQLVAYQADAAKSNSGTLSGVLYLHPQSDNLACEKLGQNLEALVRLFGEPWLSYFTFAIVGDVTDESDAVQQLQDPSSPYHPFHAAGAKFQYLPFLRPSIRKVLSEFNPVPVLEPRFYSLVRSNKTTELDSLMDQLLAPQPATVTNKTGRSDKVALEAPEPSHQQSRSPTHELKAGHKTLIDKSLVPQRAITANKTGRLDKVALEAPELSREQSRPPRDESKPKLRSSTNKLTVPQRTATTDKINHPGKVELEEPEASHQQHWPPTHEPKSEHNSLQYQLEQAQLENAILRSELQLNDNTEQSKILQLLEDINHAVDAFGRSIAEYMFDQYGAERLKKDDPTTLDAAHSINLRTQFGHQTGKSSLVMSSKNAGLHIEDFVDFALRGFVLRKLCKDVFIPFHPTLMKAESDFMSSLYEKIRGQASPAVAAKWRMSTFMALSMGNKLHESAIDKQVENLVSEDIQLLLNNIFGRDNPVTLTDSHRSQLRGIITSAWEFNYVLKAEVLALGDFQPFFCEPGVPFNPTSMVAFEPNQRAVPDVALSTVKLGLTLSYSKESGKDANPSVILKATVVTPAVYG